MPDEQSLILVPFHEDPLYQLASHLLTRRSAAPLNLQNCIVLFNDDNAVLRFRETLLVRAKENGIDALIPPFTGTLSYWLKTVIQPDRRALTHSTAELLLLDALNDHPRLCKQYGAWPLIDSLLALFNELERNQLTLPDSADELLTLLSNGYDINNPGLMPLSSEARLVHTLWKAWRQQLHSHNIIDEAQWMALGLTRSLGKISPHQHIYLVGVVSPDAIEYDWIRKLQQTKQITVVLHGQVTDAGQRYHPDAAVTGILQKLDIEADKTQTVSPLTEFLNQVYNNNGTVLYDRAHQYASTTARSPAIDTIAIYRAPDAENEARGIELQVRRWILAGHRDIGIITNDRKLARRVRALLDRANVSLLDTAGWAMSTTSAAAALNRWLECIESGFHHTALLDLLKSPFFLFHDDDERQAALVLEHKIILSGNISSGIANYRKRLLDLVAREKIDDALNQSISRLLDRLAQSSMALLKHIDSTTSTSPARHLKSLFNSLQSVGLATTLTNDDAGNQLLANLESFTQENILATPVMSMMTWSEFRHWLHRQLEQHSFRPDTDSWQAVLLNLSDSRLFTFDAVIIAGASEEHLPGPVSASPFFNDNVRRQLGLPQCTEKLAAWFYDFRRLLESAPRALISVRRENDGQAIASSSWLELLNSFHMFAYQTSLTDNELSRLVETPGTEIIRDSTALPEPTSSASSVLPIPLIPESVSASAYQRLVDCPYQFYASYGLGLWPVDQVCEDIEKQDYGQYVHRVLQAFHSNVSGLPGPFKEPPSPENRQQAEATLNKIADAVFADALATSFLARGWLYRWKSIVPAYLDWAIKRAAIWRSSQSEQSMSRPCKIGSREINLVGRLDQIDICADGVSIIDYKTGAVADANSVESAENIQLPFYALLAEQQVKQALFLKLEPDKVSDRIQLDNEDLISLKHKVTQQLTETWESLYQQVSLPANGDQTTCSFCDVETLCRRSLWS